MKKYGICILLWIILVSLPACGQESASGGPTLPGADEIYPSVQVEGKLYEWRMGAAILDELPEASAYYAGIEHISESTPGGDGEFASTFDAAGDIYTVSEDDSCVYLVLSTDWMENTVVVFDRVSD